MSKSNIEIEQKTASSLQCRPLEDEGVTNSLSAFKDIVMSCYGPRGRIKMLQNSNGGHVTMTSSSTRLFQTLPLSKPLLKALTSAIQAHLNIYKDGGLFASCLASLMLQESLSVNIHKKLLIDVYDQVLNKVIDYIKSPEFPCKSKVDITEMSSLRCIVRSVLKSKPGSGFLPAEVLSHLTNLVIEAFLKSYSVQGESICWFCPVTYVCVEGRSPAEAHIVDGVLFETSVSFPKQEGLPIKTDQQKIRVALVTVSMSGDSSDYVDVSYESDAPIDGAAVSVASMLQLCDRFLSDDVGVVLCQKVIHPSVKRYLLKKGILPVERLGASYAAVVKELTGAVPINSLHEAASGYGWLDSVTEHMLENKRYLHLQREGASVCSLVLYHRMEESLQEIKNSCEVALNTLRICLQTPYVMCGAGCWQTNVASYIRGLIKHVTPETLDDLGSTKLQYQNAGRIFAQSIERCARALDGSCDHLMDSTNHHHWMIPKMTNSRAGEWPSCLASCGCGQIKNTPQDKLEFHYMGERHLENTPKIENSNLDGKEMVLDDKSVMDSYSVMLNSLKVSVSACNILLGISHVISDDN